MSTSAPPTGGPDIELEIGGMTCASCANRIEKKLNKLEGVAATVNYATEKAHILAPAEASVERLIGVVEAAGYGAAWLSGPAAEDEGARRQRGDVGAERVTEHRGGGEMEELAYLFSYAGNGNH